MQQEIRKLDIIQWAVLFQAPRRTNFDMKRTVKEHVILVSLLYIFCNRIMIQNRYNQHVVFFTELNFHIGLPVEPKRSYVNPV